MTRITVTQKLIDDGKRGECRRCPIALAIKEHAHDGCYVVVGREEVDLEFMNRYACLPTPSKAAKFIAAYDGTKPVAPFEFELDIPEWALKEVV